MRLLVIGLLCLSVHCEEQVEDDNIDSMTLDELRIKWDDDIPAHPRRIERESVDYIEKTLNIADQFAALIGGFDGALNVATVFHDELSEFLGHITPEMAERKKERDNRMHKLLPLFESMEDSKERPASKEEYELDLGSPDQKIHTAKDMIFDAFHRFVEFVQSNETKSRPTLRVFDDEL